MTPRRGGVAAPSLAAGVGLALSLPPFGLWPLAFVGAAVLYWRLAGLRPGARLLAGWLAGLGCFVPGLFSLRSFNWYGAAALMAVEALSMAAAAVLVPPERGRLCSFVGAFTLLEAVRMTWPFGGVPLGGVFLGQAGGPLLVVARLGGPLLLTALVWLGGAALGELVINGHRALAGAGGSGATSPGVAPGALGGVARGAGALAVLVVLCAAGAVPPAGGAPIRHLRTAVIQGGGRRGFSKDQVNPNSVFSAQLAATHAMERADRGRTPALVLWPEDVISLSGPLAGSPQAAIMAGLARKLRTTLVAGVTETVSAIAFRNEIVAWGPSGHIVAVYEKVHRVPFGEYVPYRSFFAHFANLTAVPLDAVPGHGTGLMKTPAAPLGVLVSYEVFYADRSRPSVAAGAQLLRNKEISVTAAARAQLITGQVDSRLLTTLAVLAAQHALAIVGFADSGPGASAGIPLRSAEIAAPGALPGPAPAGPGSTRFLRSALAFLRAQRPPYLAASLQIARLPSGQGVVRVEFAGPSPLGLLTGGNTGADTSP